MVNGATSGAVHTWANLVLLAMNVSVWCEPAHSIYSSSIVNATARTDVILASCQRPMCTYWLPQRYHSLPLPGYNTIHRFCVTYMCHVTQHIISIVPNPDKLFHNQQYISVHKNWIDVEDCIFFYLSCTSERDLLSFQFFVYIFRLFFFYCCCCNELICKWAFNIFFFYIKMTF